jgi:hypothetical protein
MSKPEHTTKSHHTQQRDKFIHSSTGLSAKHGQKAAKGGAGGAFTWGTPMDDAKRELEAHERGDYDDEQVDEPAEKADQ